MNALFKNRNEGQSARRPHVNVWESLAARLTEPQSLPVDGGIWGQIAPLPGGLWQAARDETLILPRRGRSIWVIANDRTLVSRSPINLWKMISIPAADVEPAQDLWGVLSDETLIIKRDAPTVWKVPAVRNFKRYKPQRGVGWALKELSTSAGEKYWVLKSLTGQAYMRLDPQQYVLWNMLDGSHSIQDLAVESFVQFGSFNVEALTGFLGMLEQKGFLSNSSSDIYQESNRRALLRSPKFWAMRAIGLIFQSEISLPVDGFYAGLYRTVGWLFFTRLMLLLMTIISLAGVPAYLIVSNSYSMLAGDTSGASWLSAGLISLILAEALVLLVHESSHALTTRRYGRHVRRGGVGLYFGMIAFFMDTTDIWMEPRGPRLAVTWAGPFSGFILGGITSLLLLFVPGIPPLLAQFLFQVGAIGYIVSVSNMNPLLKFDGYYILMDWLEIPMLRERSMRFVRSELWTRIKERKGLSREEIIFTLFGAAALLYSAFMILLLVQAFGSTLVGLIRMALGLKGGY